MMKKLLLLAFTSVFNIIIPCASHAQSTADPSLLLAEQLKSVSTFRAQFSQVIENQSDGVLQQVQGELIAVKPNRFYWHSQVPYEQTIVSNSQTMWIIDNDLEQVTIQKLDSNISRTPALLLSGQLEELASSFAIKLNEHRTQAGVLREYTLKPKNNTSLFDTMVLRFRGEVLSAMELLDQTGQRTSIRFENVKVNQVVDGGVFQPKIPQGYDIIDQLNSKAVEN